MPVDQNDRVKINHSYTKDYQLKFHEGFVFFFEKICPQYKEFEAAANKQRCYDADLAQILNYFWGQKDEILW